MDPYKVLGVSRNASPDEIKAAFHTVLDFVVFEICEKTDFQ